jgi:hypothetical protein
MAGTKFISTDITAQSNRPGNAALIGGRTQTDSIRGVVDQGAADQQRMDKGAFIHYQRAKPQADRRPGVITDEIRRSGIKTKFYQASSSELFGSAPAPQNELTRFQPQSPYACAKLYSYWLTKNYRDG